MALAHALGAQTPAPAPVHGPGQALDDEIPTLSAPADLVEEYLTLMDERRALDERLAFVRAELELTAAPALTDSTPRARFVGARGAIGVRLQPTCVFDRAAVARELQRMGKLADVAVLQGPGLARYLAKEPQVAARVGSMVRMRKSVMLSAHER